jgi:opacity protein-like surface antigen
MCFAPRQRSVLLFLLLNFVLAPAPGAGQEPRIAGTGPTVNFGLGYTYLNAQVPAAGRISEQGLAAGLTTDFTNRIGIRLEATYTRNYGAFGLPRHNDVLAYLAGPVFYPVRHRRFAVYGETLFGAARVAGATVASHSSDISGGWTNDFAWSAGGGVEAGVSRAWTVRTGADYLQAKFFSPNGAIHGQGNVRIIVSLVYAIGKSSASTW